MHQVHGEALDSNPQRLGNRFGADPVQRRLLLVDDKPRLRLVGLDIPVDIHHAGGLLENVPHIAGQRQARGRRRPVHLGDQCLKHRRSGRHLGDGDSGIVFGGDRGHSGPHPFGDVVALRLAFALVDEVDLEIGDVGAPAHEVMPHQPVEIERRRGADVNLIVRHLRLVADRSRNSRAAWAVRSNALPSGMFRIT